TDGLVVGSERRHLPDVRIQHAGRRLRRRPWRVPDRAVARDRELRLIRRLRRRIVRELLALRIEADQAAALASVADPDLIVAIGPPVGGLGERHRNVVLDDAARFRVDLAELAAAEAAVPDDAGGIDAESTDGRRRERRVLGEFFRLRIEARDLAASELG